MSRKITTVIIFLLVQVFCCSVSSAQENRTINTNTTISQDTIWDGTIIIDGAKVTVEQNATLTLKPGTKMAGKNGALIYIIGKLKVLGEKDKKIKFLEEYNEKPNFSLTYFIDSTSTSEIEMKNFVLESGGGNQDIASLPALTLRGKAELSQGIIRRNRIAAVRVWNKDVKIEDCEIYENGSIGIENKSTDTLKAENNWWGSSEGPVNYSMSNTNRDRIKGDIDFNPWQEKGPIPIVILPGFGGSFSFKLLTEKADDNWWLNPIGTSAYRYFVKALVLSNYFHDKDFFWGFYDWRMPCEESAKKYLEKIIDEAKEKSGHSQVHIIAHSMGGLVARSYIQGDGFRDDVDQLITAGTPHLGSSEVYSIWEGGKLLGGKWPLNLYLWYLEALNQNWNKLDFIKKNFPSIGQMMPIYDYLVNNDNGQSISYLEQKERNRFLEYLDAKRDGLRRQANITLVTGTNQDTLEKICVDPYLSEENAKWVDGMPNPIEPTKDTNKGDGTVTEKSATVDGKLTENIIHIDSSHGQLLELGEEKILEQLKVQAKFPLLFKIMHHFLLSAKGPVDIEIENSQGKMLSASRNKIEDGQYFEQKVNGEKLIFSDFPIDIDLKENRLLKITLTGEGEGQFKAAFWHLSNNDDFLKQEENGSISDGVKIIYELKFDEKENGTPEVSVEKETWSNLLRVSFPEANQEYLNWRRISPEVIIWQSSDDPNSVSNIEMDYELDGEPAEKDIDLGRLSLGVHNLKVLAKWEKNGQEQKEEKEVSFLVGTSCKSLITLVDRFYQEKKILNWDARSQLINLLAEAYQEVSNKKNVSAQGKIGETKNVLASFNDDVLDGRIKERLMESLEYLEDKPK